jgi:hypothetical protein
MDHLAAAPRVGRHARARFGHARQSRRQRVLACEPGAVHTETSSFASRRSVFTRSPARTGISDGATTSHGTPILVSSRHSADPPGPAS